ncbi:MAG: transglutaminase family protein [Phenylobacterium sp.]
MPILTVRHLTRYTYRRPVGFGEHRMMFRPRESYDQRVIGAQLTITPEPVSLRYMHDVFGNCIGVARFDGRSDALTFESLVELDHQPAPVADEAGTADALYPVSYSPEDLPDLMRSIERAWPDPERVLERWARRFARDGGSVLDLLAAMTRSIRAEFRYEGRLEVGVQSPLETLRRGSGSCRDFAVLMIEAARSLNLAARFASGYIYSAGPETVERTGGGHTHAWVRIYLPRCGWVDFDPTNGIVGSEDLVCVAVSRDPAQALPLHGVWMGEASDYIGMTVEVDVNIKRDREAMLRVA